MNTNRTRRILTLILIISIAITGLPITTNAALADYDTATVGKINDIIIKNGLSGYSVNDPDNWGFAKWDNSTPKQLVELELTAKKLTGHLNLSSLTFLIRLYCNDNNLTSLNVTDCSSLERLYCYSNQFSTLDITSCTALKLLNCGNNQLSSLDLSKNIDLEVLHCFGNQLTALNVSTNSKLKELAFYYNQISSFDISNNTSLEWLDCSYSELTSLNVSGCTSLKTLHCNNNQLTSLDVTGCTALRTLFCNTNQLPRLDVTDCTLLAAMRCDENRLTSLDVTDLNALYYLNCSKNYMKSENDVLGYKSNITTTFIYEPQYYLDTPYVITISASAGGNIVGHELLAPNTEREIEAAEGSSSIFHFTPDDGYKISDVLVDGISVGAVGIYTFNNVTANHRLRVEFEEEVPVTPSYTITATAGTGGNISPSGEVSVIGGESRTFTFTPESGYYISDILVDGISVGTVSTYTFSNVAADHTISAKFNKITHTVTASAGLGGSISPAGTVTVNNGGSQTFTITPEEGYAISNVLVDGVSFGVISTYTFDNINANHVITAQFRQLPPVVTTYTIIATSGAGGSISPSGTVSVKDGESQTFNITHSNGYTISNVIVDGVSVGAVATYTFSNVAANHTITVQFREITHTITAAVGTGGSISPSGAVSVREGNSQTFTITPGSGYYISDVFVNGISVGAVGTYTFSNVIGAHIITAVFKEITHTITATAGAGGNISPSGTISVRNGSSQTYTITPGSGYYISDVLIDGASIGAVGTYTFNNVFSDRTITAEFREIAHTITATAGTGGSISPSGTVSINAGSSHTFTITPENGYYISDVLVNGISAGAFGTYTFSNVVANHTITAVFKEITHTITATAESGGSISPSGEVSVIEGDSRTFTFTPESGYYISDVLVDGISVGTVSTYSFSNIAANHTISAKFNKITHTVTASAGLGGSISPAGTVTVNNGSSQTFTITPEEGYAISNVLVDGVSFGVISTYTFDNITANHVITAQFRQLPPVVTTYTIIATSGAGGSISPSGTVSVKDGESQTFNITPSNGYTISNVLVNGIPVGAVDTYTFSNVFTDHTITAQFKPDTSVVTYTITASAETGGHISPSGTVSVYGGGSHTFTITPSIGYTISDVLVDGVSVGAVDTHTLSNITANHIITAQFEQDIPVVPTYNITTTAGPGGRISPSGTISVPEGDSQSFTITPDDGYIISAIYVNDRSITIHDKFSPFNLIISEIEIDITLKAVFKARTKTTEKFKDLKADAWYLDAVDFIVNYGLFEGVSDTEFGPDGDMSRAMFVQVLMRLSDNMGFDTSVYSSNTFKDVKSDAWYREAVSWAASTGVVTGYDANTFGPDDKITREQMAAMLIRFLDYAEITLITTGDSEFNDADKVSAWAKNSVQKAAAGRLVSGVGDGRFDPLSTATRAQVAKLFGNLVDNYFW